MSKCISPAQAGAKRLPGPHTLHFLDKSRINQLLWHVHVHVKTVVAVLVCGILPGVPFDCAGSLKTVVPVLASWPRHFTSEFFYKLALVTCPCPISMRRSCGDPGGVLSTRSLHALVQLLMKKSCGDPGGILFCADPYAQVLWRSRWNPLRGPCVILHRPVVPHKAVAEVIGNL